MKDGYLVADVDLHLVEPASLWDRLEEPYRSLTRVVDHPERPNQIASSHITLGGRSWDGASQLTKTQTASRMEVDSFLRTAHRSNPRTYLEAMDIEGIDVAVLVPTSLIFLPCLDGLDPKHALALCRVYNDWAAEFCAADPRRLKFWGWLPRQDAYLAAEEAARAARLGAIGSALTTGAVDDHLLSDPFFEPLWQQIEELGTPLGLHIFVAVEGLLRDDVRERYRGHPRTEVTRKAQQGIFNAITSVEELILGGVLEHHPKIRPVLMEVGASWLPWVMWRMDHKWSLYGSYVDYTLSMKPSDYVRERCFVTMDVDEEAARFLALEGMETNLLLSTDFPHHDSDFPEAISTFLALPGFTHEQRRRILWDNAEGLLGLQAPVGAPR